MDDHQETWLLQVKGFRRWLARLFYEQENKTPGAQAVQDALGVLEGKALYDGAELPVYTRLTEHNGAIYLDLGNAAWQAVEITPNGWWVIGTPLVKFRRAKGMLALPEPVRGGTLAAIRPFVNLASNQDWRLLVSWLTHTFRPRGPYPILVLYGEQGSAKSTAVHELTLEASPMGPLVHDFAQQRSSWEGTASALLTELETLAHSKGTTEGVTTQPPQTGMSATMQAPKAGCDTCDAKKYIHANEESFYDSE